MVDGYYDFIYTGSSMRILFLHLEFCINVIHKVVGTRLEIKLQKIHIRSFRITNFFFFLPDTLCNTSNCRRVTLFTLFFNNIKVDLMWQKRQTISIYIKQYNMCIYYLKMHDFQFIGIFNFIKKPNYKIKKILTNNQWT